jgi:hypothetical protein
VSGYHSAVYGYDQTKYFGAGVDVDPNAQAFIIAAGITNPTQRNAIDAYVRALKSAGIWTKMVAIWPLVGGTAASHKWNLVNPVDSDAAFRQTYTANITHGATGVTKALASAAVQVDTKLIPSTAFVDNNWSAGVWNHTAPDLNNSPGGNFFGCVGATADSVTPRFTRTTSVTEVTAAAGGNSRVATGISLTSFFAITNTTSGNVAQLYINGAANGATFSTAGVLRAGVSSYMLNYNNNGAGNATSVHTQKFGFYATFLTAAEILALYNATLALQTALGR